MLKFTNILVVVALFGFPAISFAFEKGAENAEASTLAVTEASQADLFEQRRALWKTYSSDTSQGDQLSNYSADYTQASVSVEEVKSLYIIGKGIVLTK